MASLSLPIPFRYQLVENLTRLIKAGEAAAIVGMASVGKSNLVRCLLRPDVQAAYLGAERDKYLLVLVDSNDLASLSEWHLLELLLYRLTAHSQEACLPAETVTYLDELYEKLLKWDHQVTQAQRCFEQAIQRLCQGHGCKVIFLFDEFDPLYQALSPRLFVNLRSLRDKNKYSLVYLLFLRQDLADLRPATAEVEPFAELFENNMLGLKPYDLPGAEAALVGLSSRQQFEWPVHYTLPVFDLSGGHAGLTRVIFWKILPQLKAATSVDFDLFNEPEVEAECNKIWESLADDEKVCLVEWVRLGGAAGEFVAKNRVVVDKLERKGLLNFERQPPHLFSKLFANFVQQRISTRPAELPFAFDRDHQTCWVKGQEVNLPLLPARLLEFLYQHRGRPCKRADLARYLYPAEDHRQASKIPDFRLDAVVKSLREKIEPDPQNPHYIKTVRGIGFKLDID